MDYSYFINYFFFCVFLVFHINTMLPLMVEKIYVKNTQKSHVIVKLYCTNGIQQL